MLVFQSNGMGRLNIITRAPWLPHVLTSARRGLFSLPMSSLPSGKRPPKQQSTTPPARAHVSVYRPVQPGNTGTRKPESPRTSLVAAAAALPAGANALSEPPTAIAALQDATTPSPIIAMQPAATDQHRPITASGPRHNALTTCADGVCQHTSPSEGRFQST